MKHILDEDLFQEDELDATVGTQYLSFVMADEEYAIDILRVLEIRSYEQPTELPSAPHYLKGVINLRGIIIPIIDLRERFHICAGEIKQSTVVIILQFPMPMGERIMGIIVDAVSDVYNFNHDQIKLPPDLTSPESLEFIEGLAMVDRKMIIILNAEKMFSLDGGVIAKLRYTLEKPDNDDRIPASTG